MKALSIIIACCLHAIPAFTQTTLPVEDQSELRKGENPDERIRNNFFLKAEVSKTTCFVGEPLMASFRAYSRLNASSRVVRRPALTGFSVLEMVDAYGNAPETETIKGKTFNTHLIRKVQLFPLQAGRFTLEPAEVETRVFLRNPDMVKDLTLKTPPINILVKPLPQKDQPDSFSGAVGHFALDLRVDNRELYRGDPAVVKLIVSGTGNFPLITDPTINWPKGTEVSSPQVTENVNRYKFPLRGEKIFQYRLDTRTPGTFTIDPIEFSYFDPVSVRYITLHTQPATFTVQKGKKRSRFVQQLVSHESDVPMQYYYFAAVALAVLGWVVFQVSRRRK